VGGGGARGGGADIPVPAGLGGGPDGGGPLGCDPGGPIDKYAYINKYIYIHIYTSINIHIYI
jgi:hypothetical protein